MTASLKDIMSLDNFKGVSNKDERGLGKRLIIEILLYLRMTLVEVYFIPITINDKENEVFFRILHHIMYVVTS